MGVKSQNSVGWVVRLVERHPIECTLTYITSKNVSEEEISICHVSQYSAASGIWNSSPQAPFGDPAEREEIRTLLTGRIIVLFLFACQGHCSGHREAGRRKKKHLVVTTLENTCHVSSVEEIRQLVKKCKIMDFWCVYVFCKKLQVGVKNKHLEANTRWLLNCLRKPAKECYRLVSPFLNSEKVGAGYKVIFNVFNIKLNWVQACKWIYSKVDVL